MLINQELLDCMRYCHFFGYGIYGFCETNNIFRASTIFGSPKRTTLLGKLVITPVVDIPSVGQKTGSSSSISGSVFTNNGFDLKITGFSNNLDINKITILKNDCLLLECEL